MQILRSVLPVIIMLIIGMVFREKKLISEEGVKGLQSLVMNVALPAGLFGAFYKTTLSAQELILPLTLFVFVTGGIFAARLLCRLFGEKDIYMPFMASGYEFGMLGYALIAILVGSANITTFAIMDMGQCLAIFTVYVGLLKGMNGEKQSAAQVVKDVLSTPVLLAIILGSLIGVTGLGNALDKAGIGGIIDDVCAFASAPTNAAILIVIGYRMNFKGLDIRKIGKACAIRLVLQGVFAAAALLLFRMIGGICTERLTTVSLILALILPPPFILPLYIEDKDKKEFYSLTISAYTLLSVAAFIIMVAVY